MAYFQCNCWSKTNFNQTHQDKTRWDITA